MMQIESPAFEAYQTIPQKYTCMGEDISPPFNIKDVPQNSKSLVFIMEDPDAPHGIFVHWVAWNVSTKMVKIEENFSPPGRGRNDFGETDYRGPCPPKGKPHRYFFKLYALDDALDLPAGSSKDQVEKAMNKHILDKTEIIGIFQR